MKKIRTYRSSTIQRKLELTIPGRLELEIWYGRCHCSLVRSRASSFYHTVTIEPWSCPEAGYLADPRERPHTDPNPSVQAPVLWWFYFIERTFRLPVLCSARFIRSACFSWKFPFSDPFGRIVRPRTSSIYFYWPGHGCSGNVAYKPGAVHRVPRIYTPRFSITRFSMFTDTLHRWPVQIQAFPCPDRTAGNDLSITCSRLNSTRKLN